jgi:hypothetical protein
MRGSKGRGKDPQCEGKAETILTVSGCGEVQRMKAVAIKKGQSKEKAPGF